MMNTHDTTTCLPPEDADKVIGWQESPRSPRMDPERNLWDMLAWLKESSKLRDRPCLPASKTQLFHWSMLLEAYLRAGGEGEKPW